MRMGVNLLDTIAVQTSEEGMDPKGLSDNLSIVVKKRLRQYRQ